MKFKKYLIALLCTFIVVAGTHYLIQQFTAPSSSSSEHPTSGAYQFEGKHNIKNSTYFAAPDFYNMKSNKNLVILSNFKTRQQRTGYTCAPVAAAMVAEHFLGNCPNTEMEIAKIMSTSQYNGTTIKGVVKYFEHLGWNVESSANNTSPKNYKDFLWFVQQHLHKGIPIIVENVEWGGHYRVIIGYDTMGTDYTGDDVLIMADSFDLADQVQDGYNVENAQKFFYMWFDAKLFSSWEQASPWVAAWPK